MRVIIPAKNGPAAMLELGVKFLISYFIGSIMGAMVMGKLRGGVDIRTMGSGNAGGTNALRTQGVLFALGVIIIDIGKGVIGAGVVPELNIPLVPQDPTVSRTWLTLCCAAAAVLGHVCPIFHDFKGGKGAGTFIGTLIVLAPKVIIGVVFVWISIVIIFGYVGLATMTAAVALPIYLSFGMRLEEQPLFIYATIMAMCIIFWHRLNIRRMRDRSEYRNTRLMIFRRKKSGSSHDQS
jgi:glycerol-3-phosphate acyltransferase PlsY